MQANSLSFSQFRNPMKSNNLQVTSSCSVVSSTTSMQAPPPLVQSQQRKNRIIVDSDDDEIQPVVSSLNTNISTNISVKAVTMGPENRNNNIAASRTGDSNMMAVKSPEWLVSRNASFLPPEDRVWNTELAKQERRIPKKPHSDSKARVSLPVTDEQDGSIVRKKRPLINIQDTVIDDSPLETRRFFTEERQQKIKALVTGRLMKRTESKVIQVKEETKNDGLIDLIGSDEDSNSDDGDDDDDGGKAYDKEDLTKSDVKDKVQEIIQTCEKFSARLQRELKSWEGRSHSEETGCVDLTTIDAKASSSARILTEEDIRLVCPDLELKAYQLVGINWLKLLHENSVNGVLADDMGLGKTVQTIAFLAHFKQAHMSSTSKPRPHLIVVPASTLANWVNEFARFCPHMAVSVYHGSQNEREELRRELRHSLHHGEVDIILCTYTLFERESGGDDRKFLLNLKFEYLILDEAHGIKNATSSRFTQLNRINAKHRLLLSGTPVQNDLKELLSLLSFLMPNVFSQADCEILLEAFGYKKGDRGAMVSLNKMRSVLAPFVLRRLKKTVLNQLVDKEAVNVMLTMTDFQKDVYYGIMQSYAIRKAKRREAAAESKEFDFDGVCLASILSKQKSRIVGKDKDKDNKGAVGGVSEQKTASSASAAFDALEKEVDDDVTLVRDIIDLSRSDLESTLHRELTAGEANHLFTALRKAANHPLLLRIRFARKEVMDRVAEVAWQLGHFGTQCDLKMVQKELDSFSDFDLHQLCLEYSTYLGDLILDSDTLYDSPKMAWLRENLPKLMAQGHRMLVFSQWTRLLDLLEVLLHDMDIAYLRLDGSTPVVERQQLINRFSSEAIPVFLLSTKAGGLGINLTQADTVIMHDLDFNPENDRQAEDRCHRIGQTKKVTVYKLVTRDTVDEDIMAMGEKKRLLSEAVLADKATTSTATGKDSMGEIAQILQKALQKQLLSKS